MIERIEKGVYVEKTVAIKPGENGVTELDIKRLYSMDDSEVYYNLKNSRPERTKEEKAEIAEWKQEFINDFIKSYGYKPNEDFVKWAIDEQFPRNYNLSFDFDADGDIDPDKRLIATIVDKDFDEKFEWSERMEEVFSLLTDKQKF